VYQRLAATYLATETVAELYELNHDSEAALPLRRQAVALADLVFRANDTRRAFTRLNTALALARHQQFDEAEIFATEAVALGQRTHPPQPHLFTAQLDHIRALKASPQPHQGAVADPFHGSRWFNPAAVPQPNAPPPRTR